MTRNKFHVIEKRDAPSSSCVSRVSTPYLHHHHFCLVTAMPEKLLVYLPLVWFLQFTPQHLAFLRVRRLQFVLFALPHLNSLYNMVEFSVDFSVAGVEVVFCAWLVALIEGLELIADLPASLCQGESVALSSLLAPLWSMTLALWRGWDT